MDTEYPQHGCEVDWQLAPSIIDYEFDDDSDYASGLDSYPSSILSSDHNYKYENGRRYFARRQVTYPFPHDDEERNRMDLYHHVWTLMLDGKLFAAPVGPEPRILDVGTGTGIWAIDVADQFPKSQVTGIDIAPISPAWTPLNLDFHFENIEDDWISPENTFDFIHMRSMCGFVRSWPKLLAQCLTTLKPGGYLEIQDLIAPFMTHNGSLPGDHVLVQWTDLWDAGSSSIGMPWVKVHPLLKKLLTEAGFVDIVVSEMRVPVGKWPMDDKSKEIGMFMQKQFFDGAEGFTLDMFTRVLGWDRERVDVFVDQIRRELMNPKLHLIMNGYTIYARKPQVAK